jgi:glycosyltransferase 2 family protein
MKNALQVLLITVVLSLLGFGLLLLTGGKLDLTGFSNLVRIDPLFLGLLIPTILGWWLMAGWRVQLLCDSPNVNLWRATRGMLLYWFGGAVTPSATGANLVMVWYLSRYTDSRRATAVAVFSLALDLVYYAYIMPISFAILHFENIDLHFPLIGPLLGVFVGVATAAALGLAYGLAFQAHRLEQLAFWLFSLKWLKRWRRGAMRFVAETATAMLEMRQLSLGKQLMLHFSTFVGFVLHFCAANVLLAGLGLPVNHLGLFATQNIMMFLGFLIPAPGGAGYFEVTLGRAAPALGIPETAVLPFIAIWKLISYYFYVLIGPFIGAPALLEASQRAQKAPASSASARDKEPQSV